MSTTVSTRSTGDRPHVTGRQLISAIGVWIGLAAVAGVATFLGLKALAPNWDPSIGPIVVVVAEAYLALSAALVLCCGGWPGLRDRLAFRFTGWGHIGLAVGLFGVGAVVMVGCYAALTWALGWTARHTLLAIFGATTDMNRLGVASTLSLVFIVVRACLLAGLGEELLFRGALYGWLRSRWSARIATLSTTLVFTAEHGLPIIVPGAIVFGLLAGWLRERTGSTVNTLVLHVLTDTSLLIVAWILAAHHLH
jgi:membrane protease YdiL (CAAX protease family)